MKKIFIVFLVMFTSVQVHADQLKQELIDIEKQMSARLGVAVLDTQDGKMWNYNGNARFPLMSTFKTLACAKMFNDIDSGKLNSRNGSLIKKESLIEWSPVTKKYIGQTVSVYNACKATMLTSDNTAANIVLEHIGGTRALTLFLESIGDTVTRLDRIEPELNEAEIGDLRDTTTPNAMTKTIHKLLYENILESDSQNQLRKWMKENKISGSLLRSVLPATWKIADRTGSGGNGSRGIVASVWKEDRKPLIISIYLTETNLPHAERNKIIAKVGESIQRNYSIK